MEPFFQQVFTLLTSDTGSLAYHIVLAFSIIAALLLAVAQWRGAAEMQGADEQRGRRMVFGLSLLLAFRLALFLAAGLAWLGILNPDAFLPPVDRAVTLLSLVIILWLWAFPEPLRAADTASTLLLLLMVTLTVLGIVAWSTQPAGQAFNGSWPDYVSEAAALILIGIGLLLLFVRRPAGWAFGAGMLGLLLAGHLIYFLSGTTAGSFAGSVRLAQMAAYPMLLLLSQRFPAPAGQKFFLQQAAVVNAHPQEIEPEVLEALIDAALDTAAEKSCQAVPTAFARLLGADICLLVSAPDPSEKINLRCGYDTMRGVPLPQTSIDGHMLPYLTEALQRGRPVRLPGSSSAPDMIFLAAALGVERCGPLLAVPASAGDEPPVGGVILLSPYSSRAWTPEDEARLLRFSEPLARFLQQNEQVAALQDRLSQAESSLQEALARDEQSRVEAQELREQLQGFQQSADQDRMQTENVAALLASLDDMQQTINKLQHENESLNGRLEEAGVEPLSALPAGITLTGEDPGPNGDLRMALQEVAMLREALAEAQRQAPAGDEAPAANQALPSEQIEVIASIAQELRQPMSSIVGYTDFLLGESVGILGALQRKFLERVRVSTERMGRLVDDLVHVTSAESSGLKLAQQPVDLSEVIDDAVSLASGQLREKSIALRVDLPEQLPSLNADRDSMQQVLVHLLQNAGSATPAGGSVYLNGRVESSDGKLDYVLLQVTDEGGGIPAEDLPRVFSRIYHANSALIPGVGDSSVGLSIVKTLAETIGGRVWVDSEVGRGSTFSLLLPVAQAGSPPPNGSSGVHLE